MFIMEILVLARGNIFIKTTPMARYNTVCFILMLTIHIHVPWLTFDRHVHVAVIPIDCTPHTKRITILTTGLWHPNNILLALLLCQWAPCGIKIESG